MVLKEFSLWHPEEALKRCHVPHKKGKFERKPLRLSLMGTTLIKIKIMPVSPDVDLEKIKSSAKEIIEANSGEKVGFEEEPVAFGLKAVVASFSQEEDKGELEPIENSLKDLEEISSVEVVDMRRAFG